MCVLLVAGSIIVDFCECVRVVKKGSSQGTVECGFLHAAGRNTLRNADRLNDLEDCGPTHHEDEQRQQPRSDRVLLLGVLRRLGHVSSLGDVAAGLLVGHADSLLGGHGALCWVWVVRANHSNKKKCGNRC